MHAILRGADHPELGATATLAVAADLAIGLTRGRHAKVYAHTDPNEDVVAVRRAGGTTALVVADGHSGWQASHMAVEALLEATEPGIPIWDRREAVQAFHAVNERIRDVRQDLPGSNRRTRTTLAVAVVAHDDAGQRYVTHASVGDSAVFVLRAGAAYQLTRDRHHFLGDRLSAPQVAGAMDYDQTDLEPGDALLVVSDGYTGFAHPDDLPSALDGGDAETTARRVIDIAGDAGAGDNVAVAVLLPPPADARP